MVPPTLPPPPSLTLLNLAALIAFPVLQWVVSPALARDGGNRDMPINGWGVNGVICKEFSSQTVTVILLHYWLTDSWLPLFFFVTVTSSGEEGNYHGLETSGKCFRVFFSFSFVYVLPQQQWCDIIVKTCVCCHVRNARAWTLVCSVSEKQNHVCTSSSRTGFSVVNSLHVLAPVSTTQSPTFAI